MKIFEWIEQAAFGNICLAFWHFLYGEAYHCEHVNDDNWILHSIANFSSSRLTKKLLPSKSFQRSFHNEIWQGEENQSEMKNFELNEKRIISLL